MDAHFRLTDFDAEGFLREHWQKKPALIRNPWAAWRNPLEPEELAGLACEAEVESRLVTRAGDGWSLEHGPLAESRFAELGGDPWTLLVQAVDHHVPAVAALLAPFRFIPDWRIDDVMVSFAVEGGGVGPHYDQYDVFLVQGLGRRRWQIGGHCDETSPLLPHGDLRLLARFEPEEEWVLEPGDILYVPPGVSHNGIGASDDCMTYSIGFRAPSRDELVAGWSEHILSELTEDDRYADPDMAVQPNPGEILSPAIDRLHAMAMEKLGDRAGFARWFAASSTAPKYPEIDWRPDEELGVQDVRALLGAGVPLVRNPASRMAFLRLDGGIALFADGHEIDCPDEAGEFAQHLCAETRIADTAQFAASDAVVALVVTLANRGTLAFDGED